MKKKARGWCKCSFVCGRGWPVQGEKLFSFFVFSLPSCERCHHVVFVVVMYYIDAVILSPWTGTCALFFFTAAFTVWTYVPVCGQCCCRSWKGFWIEGMLLVNQKTLLTWDYASGGCCGAKTWRILPLLSSLFIRFWYTARGAVILKMHQYIGFFFHRHSTRRAAIPVSVG